MNAQDFTSKFSPITSPIKGVRLPEIKLEKRHLKELHLKDGCSNYDFLRALCEHGLRKVTANMDVARITDYCERMEYELSILNELGFVDYILLVWDVVNFCKESNIPTGPGRGSAAGSLVLFLIGVTKIDSLKHGLYFERFVSKTRAKKSVIDGITYLDGSLMPDVDIDFDYYQRHKVLEYVDKKYPNKTAKILTLNTLSSKLVIKEVGKVLGMKEEEEMTMVTGFIPKSHGIVEDLKVAHDGKRNKPEDVEKSGEWKVAPSAEFVAWCNQNPLVYDTAAKLEGLVKNKGVHPSGILVSYDKLDDCCPTELSSDKEGVSGFDMNWVSLFSVKLDALGLRSVSVVDDCCKSLGIKSEDIDISHSSIYLALQDLKLPHGLFQIEADTNFRVTQKVKPRNIEELAAVLALARPGALQFVDKYANFTNTGTLDCNSGSEVMDKILAETGGCCLFQETMMRICKEVFGLSLEEAELVRRACGKKKVDEMRKFEKVIKDNAAKLGIGQAGDFFWNLMLAAADYSFNKSHALAYAVLSAQTIYLKFNHPTAFYLSLLKMTRHEPDPIGEIAKIHKEMLALDVELLPPSLTLSEMDFCIEGKNIRFGLSSIKGISEKTMEKINNFKRVHANKFELFTSAKEAGLSIGVLSALIQAGTLDSISKNRVLLVYEAQLWNILTEKEKKYVASYAHRYNDNVAQTVLALVKEIKDEKSKPIIKESRFETIKSHSEKYKLIYQQNKVCQDFANWWYENKLLGYTANKRLIDIFISKKESLEPVAVIKTLGEKTRCDFIGVIAETPTTGKSKNGNAYAKFIISDETGTMKVMIFKDKMEQCKVLNNGLPKEGDIVIVCGTRMDEDTMFADTIASQQNKIYTRLSELKDAK
jgi:DNA polymerase-3 subunit alpha